MVFVMAGSMPPFKRLIEALKGLSPKWRGEVLYQGLTDPSGGLPFKTLGFVERAEFYKRFEEASILVSHCGIGSIHDCVTSGKRTILVPRRADFGEHFNNHQLEVFEEMSARPLPNVYTLLDPAGLEAKLEEVAKREPLPVGGLNLGRELKQSLCEDVRRFLRL